MDRNTDNHNKIDFLIARGHYYSRDWYFSNPKRLHLMYIAELKKERVEKSKNAKALLLAETNAKFEAMQAQRDARHQEWLDSDLPF